MYYVVFFIPQAPLIIDLSQFAFCPVALRVLFFVLEAFIQDLGDLNTKLRQKLIAL